MHRRGQGVGKKLEADAQQQVAADQHRRRSGEHRLPRQKGHHRDWVDACKGGPAASSNFEYGAALTEVGLLGLAAMRTRKKIYWDAKAMKATNAPEADKYLQGTYRKGWEVV